jgi:hypothetical protein
MHLSISWISQLPLAFTYPSSFDPSAAARRAWGEGIRVVARVIDTETEAAAASQGQSHGQENGTEDSKECVIIGIVYKDMQLKPSVSLH